MFTDLVQLGFEEQAVSVYVSEMNLDEKQAQQMTQKKVEVLAEQQDRKQERQSVTTTDQSNKKKNNRSKGLKSFLDNDDEFTKYKQSMKTE